MAYNTEIFERAAHARGFVIENIQKSSIDAVKSMTGAVINGTLVKRVKWDESGKCYSYRCRPLPHYDLQLDEVLIHIPKKDE